MTQKVVVDFGLCESNGVCMGIIPEVFDLDDEDYLHILQDEVTTYDNALSRPWTVTKNYVRDRNPIWVEAICAEGTQHVRIEGKSFMLSADGELMPAKKGQEPPTLRHFDQSKK